MIGLIIELLKTSDFYGVSEYVDIAKGKHEMTSNIKKIYKQQRRKHYKLWRKNGQLN